MEQIQTVDLEGRPRPLVAIERDAIMAALDRRAWNVWAAGRDLGISYATIYNRLKAYGVFAHDVARNRAAARKNKESAYGRGGIGRFTS